MFESLDFVYVPCEDVVGTSDRYVEELGASLRWRARTRGTIVACLALAKDGPLILLADHLQGDGPILRHRVADYGAAVAALCAAAVAGAARLAIPHGPLAEFRAPGGRRLAVYQRTRPGQARPALRAASTADDANESSRISRKRTRSVPNARLAFAG